MTENRMKKEGNRVSETEQEEKAEMPDFPEEESKKELLVVSFGTSYMESCRKTIGAIEDYLEAEFSDYVFESAFTSQMIIDRLRKRDGIVIWDVDGTVKYAAQHNVSHLVIQPTHLMAGNEYEKLCQEAKAYENDFEHLIIGKPVLSSERDFVRMIQILTEELNGYLDGKTAICLMGHGSEAKANEVYTILQKKMLEAGHRDYFVGTVEAEPALTDLVQRVQQGNYDRVVLAPLMIVAGDHASHDMAGSEENSWKSTFEALGKEVVILMRGLGELKEMQELIADHAREAMQQLTQEN